MELKRYTLAVLVDNAAGVLSQVSRLFSRKGYNIESLAVGPIEDPTISRITIEILAHDEGQIELICNQLRKLLPVHSVKLLEGSHAIRRELTLIKVRAETAEERSAVIQISSIFRASIIGLPDAGRHRRGGQDGGHRETGGPSGRAGTGAHRRGGSGTGQLYH